MEVDINVGMEPLGRLWLGWLRRLGLAWRMRPRLVLSTVIKPKATNYQIKPDYSHISR